LLNVSSTTTMPSVKHTGDMTKQRRQITEYLVIILRFFFF
jgi:hypothetical protein